MNDRSMPKTAVSLFEALDQLGDAAVVIDAAERIVSFNAAAEHLWGLDRLEVVGRAVRECLPELGAAVVRTRAARRVWQLDTPSIEEIAVVRPDGERGIASVGVSQVVSGDVTVYLAIARDVSAEVRWREELQLVSVAADQAERAVIITDSLHRIAYANRPFARLFGYERAEVVGRSVRELLANHLDSAELMDEISPRIETAQLLQHELYVRDAAGRPVWVHAAAKADFDASGRLRYTAITLSDITETKQLHMLQRDVLEAVAKDLPLADVMHLICRRVEALAPRMVCSVLSVDGEGQLHCLAAPSLPSPIVEGIEGVVIGPAVGSCGTAAFRGEPVTVTDIEIDPLWVDFRALVLPHGFKSCWSSPIKLSDGRVAGTFAFYSPDKRGPSAWDEQLVETCLHLCMVAFERHFANERIAELAYSDTLTGLPNRTRLRDRIRERIAGTSGNGAFLFLDIDRFKDVNDTLGHAVGDRLLVEIARRIKSELGPGQVVSRYGGDEFVVLAEPCDADGASGLARRIIERLLAPVVIENMLLPVSASIGISIYPDNGRDEDTLLKHADAAMYEAKAAGGSTFRFFRPEMNAMAQERLVLGAALREAVSRRQLKLHYQPQLDCRTLGLRGVEALARWTHPMFGEVSPARFIALAEECGLIERIGRWALNEACEQLARWQADNIAVPGVSVNLSAVHFRNADLAREVAATLDRHGLAPDMLTIEITEGVIMDDNPVAIETAKAIHALGVKLSLDDFGTGYSSLSYLARLPIDELKIDRSFVKGLDGDRNTQAVVTAVVKIGQSLGLAVVAEGVEQRSQQRFLQTLDCDAVQGYLISPALSANEFAHWYANYSGTQGPFELSGAA